MIRNAIEVQASGGVPVCQTCSHARHSRYVVVFVENATAGSIEPHAGQVGGPPPDGGVSFGDRGEAATSPGLSKPTDNREGLNLPRFRGSRGVPVGFCSGRSYMLAHGFDDIGRGG